MRSSQGQREGFARCFVRTPPKNAPWTLPRRGTFPVCLCRHARCQRSHSSGLGARSPNPDRPGHEPPSSLRSHARSDHENPIGGSRPRILRLYRWNRRTFPNPYLAHASSSADALSSRSFAYSFNPRCTLNTVAALSHPASGFVYRKTHDCPPYPLRRS